MADRSALLDALDWFDRPAQSVMQLLRGNPGAAGRHALDFLAGPLDLVPGDLIPEIATPEDQISGGEFLGVDRETSPFLASLADVGVSAGLNPLSYLGFGKGRGVTLGGKTVAAAGKTVDPLTLAGKAGRMAIDSLPEGPRAAANAGLQRTRETLGWLNPDAGIDDLIARSDARMSGIGRAKKVELQRLLKGTDPEDRKRAFRLIQNYERDAKGLAKELGPSGMGRFGTVEEQDALLEARAAAAAWTPEEKARALALAKQAARIERLNFQEAVEDFPAMDSRLRKGQTLQTHAPLDYAQRTFDLEDQPNALHGRKLAKQGELVKFLNDNPDLALDEDLAAALTGRAAQQGRLAKRAIVGQELINRGMKGEFGENIQGTILSVMDKRQKRQLHAGEFRSLSDEGSRTLVNDVIDELKKVSPDDARMLQTAWSGLKPNRAEDGLASAATLGMEKLNSWFKPAAVVGLGWPGKVSAPIRNALAFPTQLAGEEAIGWGQAGKQLLRTPQTIGHALGTSFDHTFGTSITKGATAENARLIDHAFEQAGGRYRDAIQVLKSAGRDDLVAALERGVLDSGFSSAEKMLEGVRESRLVGRGLDAVGASATAKERFYNWLEAPAEGFKAAEDFGRSQNFFDLRKEMGDEAAAGAVRRGLYNYNAVSEGQRDLATFLPFAKFTTNAVRQNANFISRSPVVATAAAGLYGDSENEPIYPYLQEQAHLRMGRDEEGNPQYLAGLGLPIEALNQVPNIFGNSSIRSAGRDIERIVGGSSQPMAKTIYSAVSGHDPYFGTQFGSYEKLPVVGEAGDVGRIANLITGTGLVQPLETPANMVGKLFDERMGPLEKTIDSLTGVNFVSVDPDRAVQQQLTRSLEMNPDVRQSRTLYAGAGADDETRSLLRELQQMRAAARKDRAAVAGP